MYQIEASLLTRRLPEIHIHTENQETVLSYTKSNNLLLWLQTLHSKSPHVVMVFLRKLQTYVCHQARSLNDTQSCASEHYPALL